MSTAATSTPDKAFATLRARAALQGVVLCRTDDERGVERFIVNRWNLTRELPDLAAVEVWLGRLEGRKP
jgi:hypothetical protein